MSKKKDDSNVKIADFFAVQLEQKEQEVKDNAVVGIPLQAISLQYLFSNDVFPLGRMTELVGVSESCKTAFLFEIFRWHVYNCTDSRPFDPAGLHGGYIHNLAEPRDSPDLRASIMRLGARNPFPVFKAACVEDWQKRCSDWIKRAEEMFEAGSMPYPVCLGQDSLTAVTTKNEMDATWKQGYAEPTYAQIAKSINLWTKVFFPKMEPWPVSFVAVNHMKENKASNGAIIRTIPGGAALKYASTFMFRLQRKSDIELIGESGRIIEIVTEKNSLSPANHEKLIVRMTWTYDEEGEQITIWDWHDATIELLISFDGSRKKRLMDIVPLELVDKTRRTADCAPLGLKKASWSEIGAAIMQDPQMVKELQLFFNIRKRYKFKLGVPYSIQQAEANAIANKEKPPEEELS